MARVDKTESAVGVVRATLSADIDPALVDTVVGVGLDATGKIVVGAAGNSGFIGVLVPDPMLLKAGQQADIFKLADIEDITGLTAGTKYYLDAAGALTTDAAAGANAYAGYTVEADRLILAGF